ncbi:MAG TPA: PaaI family thioesterase [Alphaproteobacteria bacterium]|nr:PaaI family thioesterase [Alphaproteobacteria bacterium]
MSDAGSAVTLERMQAMLDGSPFIRLLKMRAVSIDAERQQVVMELPLTPEFERHPGTGQFHGGVIASLIDVAGDFALVILLGGGVPTINLRVDYLRPAGGNKLKACASVRRAGRTIGVVDVDVLDGSERLIAIGRGCYSMAVG